MKAKLIWSFRFPKWTFKMPFNLFKTLSDFLNLNCTVACLDFWQLKIYGEENSSSNGEEIELERKDEHKVSLRSQSCPERSYKTFGLVPLDTVTKEVVLLSRRWSDLMSHLRSN